MPPLDPPPSWRGRLLAGRVWLVAVVTLFAAAHLYRIGDGPGGFHECREADTASVAENFYAESWDALRPRVHARGAGAGVVGQEFPLYNYTTAVLWRALGYSHAWPRLLSVLAACLYLVAVHRLVRVLGLPAPVAGLAVFALACSPLVFFYGRKIMPDVLAAALVTCGLVSALGWARDGRRGAAVLGAALLALGGLVKPTHLCAGTPLLVMLVERRGWRALASRSVWLFGLAVLLPVGAWYAHARALGGDYFLLQAPLADSWRALRTAAPYKRLFLQWPWELWLVSPLDWAFPVGVWALARRPQARCLAAWIAGCYLVMFAFASQLGPHDYYTLPLAAPVAIVAAAGLAWALERGGRLAPALVVLTMVAMPAVTWGRIHHRYSARYDFAAGRALAAAHLAPDARVVAYDYTAGLVLYRLGRFGWTLSRPEDLGRVPELARQGARYLAVQSREEVDLSPVGRSLGPELFRHHDIVVYALRQELGP